MRKFAFLFSAVSLVIALPALAAVEITSLTEVAISQGNLIIVGKTRLAGSIVILDDGVAKVVSDADHNFKFQLVYLPSNCIVQLKVGVVVKSAVVTDCGPRGLNPRGAWRSTLHYLTNDLVTLAGSTWGAKSDNAR
jgi:hypothetical protein